MIYRAMPVDLSRIIKKKSRMILSFCFYRIQLPIGPCRLYPRILKNTKTGLAVAGMNFVNND